MLNDTMVVFTSDHGYFYGEHGLNEERRLAYEETIRVPVVIRYPPLTRAGSTPPEMVLGSTSLRLSSKWPESNLAPICRVDLLCR